MADNQIPVYLFTGFLEAGKTTFMQDTLQDKEFNSGENILVLVCEEGTEEFDPTALPSKNVFFQTVDEESKLTPALLTTYTKKYKAKHIMVEYNGMWMLNSFFNAMPDNWFIFREMCFIDSNTFMTYNANMRQLMVDKLSSCEMVVFNRAKKDIDTDSFHKIVRGITRRAQIAFTYEDGKVWYDETEDPLPFDINAEVIDIADRDYALWYRDISEDMKKYNGKTVRFKGMVFNEKRLGGEMFCMGRHVMVCCQNDITYRAFICKYTVKPKFKTNDWAYVTAKISIEKNKLYDGPGPVLNIISTESASAPEETVATFY